MRNVEGRAGQLPVSQGAQQRSVAQVGSRDARPQGDQILDLGVGVGGAEREAAFE